MKKSVGAVLSFFKDHSFFSHQNKLWALQYISFPHIISFYFTVFWTNPQINMHVLITEIGDPAATSCLPDSDTR